MINIKYLQELDRVTIIGHNNADFDSIVSGILLEYGFRKLGIKAVYRLQDSFIDADFQKLSKELGFNYNFHVLESTDTPLFLVDFTGRFKNVVGCFDHHPQICKIPQNYIYDNSSSCAKLIYDYLVEQGIDIPEIYTIFTVYSCYFDTVSFTSTKARMKDKEWCEKMIKELGLDKEKIENDGYGITDTSLSFENYILNGRKDYVITERETLASSYIIAKGITIKDKEVVRKLREFLTETNPKAWCFIECDIKNNETTVFLIMKEYYIKTVLDGIVSRGQKIIPPILKFLKFKNDGTLTKKLIEENKLIATMESCTSGLIASNITDYEGASAILKGSDITYSNAAKILQGVPEETIDTYGVYSLETSIEMAAAIKRQYKSDIGVGITGSFGNVDPANADSVAGVIYFTLDIDKKDSFSLIYSNLDMSRKEIKQKTVDIVLGILDSLL